MHATPGASSSPRRPGRARSKKQIALAVAGIALIVATFVFFLPKIADYRDVWAVVTQISWPWIVALLVATVVNILTFAPPWQVALPGLGFVQALELTQASTALSIVVPGGAAAGIAGSVGILRSWGFASQKIGTATTLASLWSQFVNLTYPIVAVFLLAVTGASTALLATAAFIGAAVLGIAIAGLALVLYSDGMARDLGEVAARGTSWVLQKLRRGRVTWGGGSFERFRRGAVDLLRRRWHLLTLASFAGSLSVFVVLLVSLRALDVPASEVSFVEAFAAWALVRLISTVPITPGGVGVVELGLTGALVAFGGNNAGVVAAVLVFRFLTMVPTLVLGLLVAATFRRHRPPAAPVSETGASGG
jgi:uncharacterized protein (TIRG00374 family)